MLGFPAHLFYIPLAYSNFHRPLLCVLTLYLEKGAPRPGSTEKKDLTFKEMKRVLSFFERKGFFTTTHSKESFQDTNIFKSTKKNILDKMFPCGVIIVDGLHVHFAHEHVLIECSIWRELRKC